VALQAPSGSNRQGWQWVVVVDEPSLRRAAGGIYHDITLGYLESAASARSRYAGLPLAWVTERVYARFLEAFRRHGRTCRPVRPYPDRRSTPEAEPRPAMSAGFADRSLIRACRSTGRGGEPRG
jgi:hypothetical protein